METEPTDQPSDPAAEPTAAPLPHVPHRVVIAIAAMAQANEKSVRIVLRGGSVRGAVDGRIRAAAIELLRGGRP